MSKVDIVEKLKLLSQEPTEKTMKQWDRWRGLHADGFGGDATRIDFEGTWDYVACIADAGVAEIERLRARVTELEIDLVEHKEALRAQQPRAMKLQKALVETADKTNSLRAALATREWLPMTVKPKSESGVPVMLWFGNRLFIDAISGKAVSLGPLRDVVEKMGFGWYENGVWSEAGTGHDMFEPWRLAEDYPTHWMALPSPPWAESEGAG